MEGSFVNVAVVEARNLMDSFRCGKHDVDVDLDNVCSDHSFKRSISKSSNFPFSVTATRVSSEIDVSISIFCCKIFVRAPLHRSVEALDDARLFVALRGEQLDVVLEEKRLNFSIEKFRSLIRLQSFWLSSTFQNDF